MTLTLVFILIACTGIVAYVLHLAKAPDPEKERPGLTMSGGTPSLRWRLHGWTNMSIFLAKHLLRDSQLMHEGKILIIKARNHGGSLFWFSPRYYMHYEYRLHMQVQVLSVEERVATPEATPEFFSYLGDFLGSFNATGEDTDLAISPHTLASVDGSLMRVCLGPDRTYDHLSDQAKTIIHPIWPGRIQSPELMRFAKFIGRLYAAQSPQSEPV